MSRALAGTLAGEGDHKRAADACRIEQNVNHAVRWTHDLAMELAPVSIGPGALRPALRDMAARASEMFGVRCDVDGLVQDSADVDLAMPPSHAAHLYRIAQEAVTNAVRHGDARNIRLSLEMTGTMLRMSIEDDGPGFGDGGDAHPDGMGMHTMSDRARMVGGTLSLGRAGLGGVAVVCTCPVASHGGEGDPSHG